MENTICTKDKMDITVYKKILKTCSFLGLPIFHHINAQAAPIKCTEARLYSFPIIKPKLLDTTQSFYHYFDSLQVYANSNFNKPSKH